MLLAKKKILLAKIQPDLDVDPVPDGGNAVVTKNLTVSPYEGNTVQRDIDRDALGNDIEFNTAPYVKVTFSVELAASGVAGTAPGWGAIIRACGFSETVAPDTDVVYQPVSEGFEAVALYIPHNGQLHKATAARGTVKFGLSSGGMPEMSFEFTAKWHQPVVAPAPTGLDTSAFVTPLPVNSVNTALEIAGYAANAESVDIDIANSVVFRDVINSQQVLITDRAPAGSMTIEAPELATKDFFAASASHSGVTLHPLSVTHGKTPGQIVELSAPKVQLSGISMGDSDGILTYSMNTRLIPSDAGDDEFVLTLK
ncbi:phage tail tube protein [Oceanospirillum maris]|uniref:phage tail tube protein n=1 Tax=Oceanospirillum maris TaxID=64977 RepID=UPI00040B8724|nr:phage tail tube protein [Oceanospirillum maris]